MDVYVIAKSQCKEDFKANTTDVELDNNINMKDCRMTSTSKLQN